MIDISFLVGVALGTIVTGFCAIGSFNRGFDSVRRKAWTAEHAARKRALTVSRGNPRATQQPAAEGMLRKAS